MQEIELAHTIAANPHLVRMRNKQIAMRARFIKDYGPDFYINNYTVAQFNNPEIVDVEIRTVILDKTRTHSDLLIAHTDKVRVSGNSVGELNFLHFLFLSCWLPLANHTRHPVSSTERRVKQSRSGKAQCLLPVLRYFPTCDRIPPDILHSWASTQ